MTVTSPAIAMPREYGNIRFVRGLIWTYFFLLVFEGFLRMILPSMANALLVVRDPFLLIAYLVAHISKAFPWNKFVVMFWVLGLMAMIISFFQNPGIPHVTLYGFRASFLHVPLIFLMANVMDEQDVIRIGRWFLILSVPVAILMAMQFHFGSSHWLNRGLDNQFAQLGGLSGGKIRPPGTFSYAMGPSFFYAFVVAFIMYAQFHRDAISKTLGVLATAATCLALAVSGSRGALAAACMVVVISIAVVMITSPKQVTGFVKFALVVGIGAFVASQFAIFDEGVEVFSKRIENASGTEGGLGGFIERAFGTYLSGFRSASDAELTGAGLGLGTNAGAAMLGGGRQFLLAEGEWSRVVLELGPFIGIIYLIMRSGLVFWMLGQCMKAIRRGLMLPILLFSASALTILSGQWAQPTALGFAALGGGLTMASLRQRPNGIYVP